MLNKLRLALLNIIEVILNIEYLYLRHFSPHTIYSTSKSKDRPAYHAHAPLVAFAANLMTLAKTALYFIIGKDVEPAHLYSAEEDQSTIAGGRW